jgi:hypothetical protein
MRSRWPLVAGVVAVGIAAAVAVAVVGIALGGGGGHGSGSKADYQATVVNARDRVDYALARITKSQSIPELVSRIRDASQTVGGAASELDQAKVASGFESQNAKLVTTLRSFSTELGNTANTFADPALANSLANMNSLSFPQWDQVNAILVQLNSKGIDVQPLARH